MPSHWNRERGLWYLATDHARAELTCTGGRQDFARLHGYPIVATSIVADPSLPMQWNKIGWLLRAYRVRYKGIGPPNWSTWQSE